MFRLGEVVFVALCTAFPLSQCDRKFARKPPKTHIVSRSRLIPACYNRDDGNTKVLNHRCHLTGEGIKPPEGAVVKSYGAERSGKVAT